MKIVKMKYKNEGYDEKKTSLKNTHFKTVTHIQIS